MAIEFEEPKVEPKEKKDRAIKVTLSKELQAEIKNVVGEKCFAATFVYDAIKDDIQAHATSAWAGRVRERLAEIVAGGSKPR